MQEDTSFRGDVIGLCISIKGRHTEGKGKHQQGFQHSILLFLMLNKQAAVIYRRVSRSANGFAIMKKQHLSSFVAGQGTLVHVFLCVFRQTFKQALVTFLSFFVFFLSMKLHF